MILKAMAGIRQRESLLVLLENQAKYVEALNIQMDSAGLSAERYAIYMEGVEASQNKAKASWEGLWQTTLQSDYIKYFYEASSAIFDFTDAIGGLVPIIITAGLAYLAFASSISIASIAASVSVDVLIYGMKLLFATMVETMATNPVGWAILLVGALVMIANAIPTTQERLEKFNEELEQTNTNIKKLRDEASKVRDLANEYENLRNKKQLTNEESERLTQVQNELKDILPTLLGTYDAYGNFIVSSTVKMDDLTKAIYENIEAEKKRQADIATEGTELGAKVLTGSYRASKDVGDLIVGGRYTQAISPEKAREIIDQFAQNLENEKIRFQNLGKESQDEYIKALSDTPDLQNIFVEMQSDIQTSMMESFRAGEKDYTSLESVGSEIAEAVYKGFKDTLSELSSTSSEIEDLISKSMKGELDLSDLGSIPEKYIDSLEITANGYQVNIDKLKELQLEEARTALESAKRAEASQQEIDILNQVYTNLLAQSQTTFGQFNQTAWAYDELLWKIANDANASNVSIVNAEGQALNSAQAIYDYMSTGDNAFNHFVQQAANITGQSVQQVMTQINGMIQTTTNNAEALMNYLGATSMGVDSGFNRAPTPPKYSGTLFGGARGGGAVSGGGGGGKSQEQIRLEREIEKLNDKKKALQAVLDEFNRYIDAQKDSLALQKEEKEYTDDLMKKNKSLAKLKSDIAILALDDSEEAKAQRLKLEEDASALEEEITKEKEDRKYEIQVEALDKAQKDFEYNIKQQMNALDDKIAKYQEETKSIESVGGAVGGVSSATQSLGTVSQETGAKMAEAIATAINLSDENKLKLEQQVDEWLNMGMAIDEARDKAWAYAMQLAQAKAIGDSIIGYGSTGKGTSGGGGIQGTVKAKHNGGFAGDLKSNEVFHKLLKGEYVATESQMSNFVENILPKIASHPALDSSKGAGSISLNMPINVEGNLDSSVLPNIDKIANRVLKEINNAMKERGYVRPTSLTSI